MWNEGLWGFGFGFGFGSEHKANTVNFRFREEWFEVKERGKYINVKILCN